MKKTNYFDKSFGPLASFAGIIIFVAGVIGLFYSLIGLFLILFGAFVGFTNSSTTIDAKNKRVRYTSNVFGIVKFGKWTYIDIDMKVGIKRVNQVFRTYSRGNRVLDVKINNDILYLFDKFNNPIIPIMKITEKAIRNNQIDRICDALGITKMDL